MGGILRHGQLKEGADFLGQTFERLQMRDHLLFQVLAAEYLAPTDGMGFQVMPHLFIGIEFRTVGRKVKELELAAIAGLALSD